MHKLGMTQSTESHSNFDDSSALLLIDVEYLTLGAQTYIAQKNRYGVPSDRRVRCDIYLLSRLLAHECGVKADAVYAFTSTYFSKTIHSSFGLRRHEHDPDVQFIVTPTPRARLLRERANGVAMTCKLVEMASTTNINNIIIVSGDRSLVTPVNLALNKGKFVTICSWAGAELNQFHSDPRMRSDGRSKLKRISNIRDTCSTGSSPIPPTMNPVVSSPAPRKTGGGCGGSCSCGSPDTVTSKNERTVAPSCSEADTPTSKSSCGGQRRLSARSADSEPLPGKFSFRELGRSYTFGIKELGVNFVYRDYMIKQRCPQSKSNARSVYTVVLGYDDEDVTRYQWETEIIPKMVLPALDKLRIPAFICADGKLSNNEIEIIVETGLDESCRSVYASQMTQRLIEELNSWDEGEFELTSGYFLDSQADDHTSLLSHDFVSSYTFGPSKTDDEKRAMSTISADAIPEALVETIDDSLDMEDTRLDCSNCPYELRCVKKEPPPPDQQRITYHSESAFDSPTVPAPAQCTTDW
eukprot:Rmarinus@m.19608